jgi:adenine-specific DNA-methyltransferase
MKIATEVTSDKLRGGFYSPQPLVELALTQALHLLGSRQNVDLLEPSAGDGQFVRGLGGHELGKRLRSLTAVELLDAEASKAENARVAAGIDGRVLASSFLAERCRDLGQFDVAVGNPPFVRFQFVSPEDRVGIEYLASDYGVQLAGVSNLWIPVFLSALARLRDGGVFAFIIPADCFTGLSARVVRKWLCDHSTELHVDLFGPRSFPGVLQEVVILSGRVTRDRALGTKVSVHDHSLGESWTHVLDETEPTWTGLLLRPEHLDALREVTLSSSVHRFGEVARLQVATVTGANEFFSMTSATRRDRQLDEWTRPLLARVRQAKGLNFTANDLAENGDNGYPVWMLDTGLGDSDIAASPGGQSYLSEGEGLLLHERYKCRIRKPWHRVPVVKPGELMLSKRSHRFPRLIKNSAQAVTTDTIYQGPLMPDFLGRATDVVGSFHNSLTLLSAEMFGRSFGGGVLELVPTEVRSLLVPVAPLDPRDFEMLDQLVRSAGADDESLVEATDDLIVKHLPGLDRNAWRVLADARAILLGRRLART